ncbi:MAG: aminotransferase class III-fold pyridoxal phosphate-dependent enzyme, partial [Bacteroidales bacterium]|nr:aminotransferase class III-fold pyridoxal phosphate-dependent enzyme [Bacteroidales bacterium]
MKKYLGNDESNHSPEGFFNTGDLVSLKDNSIHYIGREKRDFFKDGFGVKVPVNSIRTYYKKLHVIAEHVEYFPLKDTPGLAALIFIKEDSVPEGIILDPALLKSFTGLMESLHIQLSKHLEAFEYRHRLISRFTVINAKVPCTVKGNPSGFKISTDYKDTIGKLTDTFILKKFIIDLEPCSGNTSSFTKYHNPHIGQLLSALSLDKTFHRGKKDSLYTYSNGEEIEVLDMTGGYGSNLLGHNNEEIKNTASTFLKQDLVPLSDQGSLQKHAGLLAEKLNLIVGRLTGASYNVIFGSTGSEAVEVAIHHALFEWRKKVEDLKHMQYQRYGAEASDLLKEVWKSNEARLSDTSVHIIALKSSFHGSSSGARSLLANTKKREAFKNILGISPVFIDDQSEDWNEQLEKELNARTVRLHEVVYHENEFIRRELNISTIIAAIAEPVIGEGGIRIADAEVIKSLSTCDYPLIMDEIQCGLGRCGSF